MNTTDTTLILLDLQRDFLSDEARLPVCRNQIPGLVDAVNTLVLQVGPGCRVAYVGNEFSKWDYPANWFRHHAAVKGSLGCLIDDKVVVLNDTFFAKHRASAFTNDAFVRFLGETETQSVALCGVFAGHCVRATCRSALRARLKTFVIRDAVADRSDASRDAALERMRQDGATVLTSREFVRELST